jgi:lysophospholipase L1-like esterase
VTWPISLFEEDGIHPNAAGSAQVGDWLLDFFENSPYTEWYR